MTADTPSVAPDRQPAHLAPEAGSASQPSGEEDATNVPVPGGVLDAGAPGAGQLQQALDAQPDGPNVAPSAHEHDAARGHPTPPTGPA